MFECGRFCVFFVSFVVTSTGSSLIVTLSILVVASATNLSGVAVVVDVDGLDEKNDAIEDFACGALADLDGAWPFFGLCVLLGLVFSSFFTSFFTSFAVFMGFFSDFTSFDCAGLDGTALNRFVGFFGAGGSAAFLTGGATLLVLLKLLFSLSNFKPMLWNSIYHFN